MSMTTLTMKSGRTLTYDGNGALVADSFDGKEQSFLTWINAEWRRRQNLTAATDSTEKPAPVDDVQKRVHEVIDDLAARRVSDPDRSSLRKALDIAAAPDTNQDRAVGRAIGTFRGGRGGVPWGA